MKNLLPILFAVSPALALPQGAADSAAPVDPDSNARGEIVVREIAVAGDRIRSWTENGSEMVQVELANGATSRPREAVGVIPLARGAFDPLVGAPSFEGSVVEPGEGLALVQFVSQPLESFAREIEAVGARIVRFVGDGAVVVRAADATTVEALVELPFVRWAGAYHAEYKLDDELVSGLRDETLGSARYRIQVLDEGPHTKRAVAARVAALGAEIDQLNDEGFLFDATLTPSALRTLVTWPEVFYVDAWTAPRTYMDKVRVDGGANYIEGVAGVTGQGVRGEVLDVGVAVNHPDLQSPAPIVHNGNGPSFHGTEVSGIVFGDGSNSPNARGLLPDAQPIVSSYTQLNNRYTHTQELLQAPYFASFQTNSWGPGPSVPGYPNDAFEMDDILFDHDLLVFQAMANEGANVCDKVAWAKNIVSVGGVQHRNTQNLADDDWQFSGSIGPCQDGRIKPELAYWYDDIRTTSGNSGYTNTFGGTSAATPEVAGHGGLMMQLWHEGRLGNIPSGATVFESRPKHSTARAIMVNTASAYDFNGVNADMTRVHQGWGRPNARNMLDGTFFVVDETKVLGNLESVSYELEVAAGEPELVASMVYLDPAGTTSSAQHRINDLTLRVTAPDGTFYWGNRGLKASNWSTAGANPNRKDTVECVRIPNPTPGTWLVDVLADEVVADAHVETAGIDADFGLVVHGIEGAWKDLGGGLAGVNGTPVFEGSGYLAGNDAYRLQLDGAAPDAATFLVVGGTNASLPFAGGVVIPSNDLLISFTTDASGSLTVDGTLSDSAAAGKLYLQMLTLDFAAPQFLSISNALEASIR